MLLSMVPHLGCRLESGRSIYLFIYLFIIFYFGIWKIYLFIIFYFGNLEDLKGSNVLILLPSALI